MDNYTIKHWNKKRPITVRSYTRQGHKGVDIAVSFKIFVRKATIVSLLAVIVGSSYVSTFFAGGLVLAPTKVEAQTIVPETPALPPVLVRIEMAESHGNQYCTEDAISRKLCKTSSKGQVLMRANKNGSIDIGIGQINNVAWGAKAAALGYDLYTREGNEAMMVWIYENQGTDPWYSSSANW